MKIGIIVIIILLIVIVGGLFYFYLPKENQQPETCTQIVKSGCKYNEVFVLSDLSALLWLRDNLPQETTVINW